MTSLIKGYGSWSETGEGEGGFGDGVDFSEELMVVFSNELEKRVDCGGCMGNMRMKK